MLRKKIIIAVIIGIVGLITSAQASILSYNADDNETVLHKEKNIFTEAKLPDSLRLIEEEAFDGTSIENLSLPRSIEAVGDRAFANMYSLKKIIIPFSLNEFGKDLFQGSKDVMISASYHSPARKWAEEHRIPFSPISAIVVASFNNSALVVNTHPIAEEYARNEEKKKIDEFMNAHKRKKGRTLGELKSSHYKGVAAQYIQSRYFP